MSIEIEEHVRNEHNAIRRLEREQAKRPRLKFQKHSMLAPPFNPELMILVMSQPNLKRGRAALAPFPTCEFSCLE